MGDVMCWIVGPLLNSDPNLWKTAQIATVIFLFIIIRTVATSFGQRDKSQVGGAVDYYYTKYTMILKHSWTN
jgi:hypothetical protein